MKTARAVAPLLAIAMVALVGCGGPDPTDHATIDGSAASELRGGATKPVTTSVTLVATPNPADRNAPMTISLYPGTYASQMLFIKWQCYQDGYMMAHDGSYELNSSANAGSPEYVRRADHIDWTFTVGQALNDNLVPGPATCAMQAWYENRKLQWFQIASGTFDLLP